MRRILSIIIVVALFAGILYAQGVGHRGAVECSVAASNPQPKAAPAPQQPRKRKIDFMADLVKPYNQGGDSVVYFIGNFAAHHNGAVIWCDSAVRYSDTRWGFFHNMVINQDSIFIYGDSAIYDGDAAHAEIYAPIIKVVDGDALLYTYNFSFNTQSKVGTYQGGGVLVHDNNILESVRGYYDAQNHDVICVERVELHGADYDMKSDSIIYNTDTEFARFFTSSEIWNVDGEYLSADEGYYDKARNLYKVTRNGYILSEEQEMWGDTLEYYRMAQHIIARNNIQMDDFKNKIMAFGDYAEYWSEEGTALLTRRPSAIGYDTSQSDTVFLSSDSLWMLTIDPNRKLKEAAMQADSIGKGAVGDSLSAGTFTSQGGNVVRSGARGVERRGGQPLTDEMFHEMIARNVGMSQDMTDTARRRIEQDSLPPLLDSAANEQLTAEEVVEPVDSAQILLQDSLSKLTPKQLKAYHAAQAKKQAQERKAQLKQQKAQERKVLLDSIAKQRQAKINIQLEKVRQQELQRMAKDSVRRAERRAKLLAKGRDVSALDHEDSVAAVRNARMRQLMQVDSVQQVDSISDRPTRDSEESKIVAEDSVKADSAYRLVKAYKHVKMFRSDAQMVCDSLVSSSLDSIIHLYIEPVMWNQRNQLASEQVDVYTKGGALEKAEFMGDPIMIAEIDTVYYNQVSGKEMTAHFVDNEIVRNDVDGNVQTIYFRTESEDSQLVTEMTYLESASATFFIEDQQLVGITYRNDVPFTMYPLALIPESQPLKLQNFKWVPQLRPNKEDVFDRTIRPAQREQRRARPRPTFPIVERMDRYKERLLMGGSWYDREDQLTPELIEWRNRNMENNPR
ncbi:MAG: hypothetical protein IIY05_03180 [Alistipes sp.]|nr:hypothetical protein [Alistipes sp.]